MPTLVIHIAQLDDNGSYPVELFTDAVAPPAGMNWYDHSVQNGTVPANG
jgi:hypothetical protein